MPPLVVTPDNASDAWRALAPIFARARGGKPRLIGTGFWISQDGVLVTAKHVIDDNIGENGKDIESIAAFQFTRGGRFISRPLRTTSRHAKFDLAVSVTLQPHDKDGKVVLVDNVMALTLELPAIGAQIATHSFHDPNAQTADEKYAALHESTFEFNGSFKDDPDHETKLAFHSRWTTGHVTEHFMAGRDSVMLPSPCIRSDMPVYGGMSGGPVFDNRGRVCAVNCTRFEGTDLAFHVPIGGILNLKVDGHFQGDGPRDWTVRELAAHKIVDIDTVFPEPAPDTAFAVLRAPD
jgi:hypothetical protein